MDKLPQMREIQVEIRNDREPRTVIGFWMQKHDPASQIAGGHTHYRLTTAAIVTNTGHVFVGVSVCNTRLDVFVRTKGIRRAEYRALVAARSHLDGIRLPNQYIIDSFAAANPDDIMMTLGAIIAAERRRIMSTIGLPTKIYPRPRRAPDGPVPF